MEKPFEFSTVFNVLLERLITDRYISPVLVNVFERHFWSYQSLQSSEQTEQVVRLLSVDGMETDMFDQEQIPFENYHKYSKGRPLFNSRSAYMSFLFGNSFLNDENKTLYEHLFNGRTLIILGSGLSKKAKELAENGFNPAAVVGVDKFVDQSQLTAEHDQIIKVSATNPELPAKITAALPEEAIGVNRLILSVFGVPPYFENEAAISGFFQNLKNIMRPGDWFFGYPIAVFHNPETDKPANLELKRQKFNRELCLLAQKEFDVFGLFQPANIQRPSAGNSLAIHAYTKN